MSVETKTSSEASEEARLAATRRQARMGTLLSLTLLALLALMWLVLAFSTNSFWTYNNITNLLRQGSMIAILAMGETFVIITAGIDLSVGAVVGFASVIVAWLLTHGFPIWASIIITLAVRLRHRRFSWLRNHQTRLAAVHHDAGYFDGAARCRSAHHKWRHHFNHQ